MDPQQPPANQPNAAPTPTPASPAPSVSSPQPTPAPPGSTAPTPAPTGKKSKRGLIFGIIGIVVIILLIPVVFLVLSGAQANNVSNKFMQDMTSGNVTTAAALTDGSSSNTAYLQQAAKSISGSYSLHSTTVKNGQHYYLYTLTSSTSKYARTIVGKVNGSYKVTSFVYSGSPLTLVPLSSSTTDMSTSGTQSTSSSTSGCLAASDFSYFSNIYMTPSKNTDGTYSAFTQVQFNPNVATYATGVVPAPSTVYSDFKKFYAADANKKYVIQLESSVNSASPDKPLANARNAKVKSDLENISGIPAANISIQPVTNDTSGNSAGDAFFRQVQITLSSANSCAKS